MPGWPAQEARRAPRGMIASVSPLASAAGLRVLQRGGNAVDAAIAAGGVLAVVDPWSGQLGGDAFLLVAHADGTVTAINGSGAAPAAARLELYGEFGSVPTTGWLAATVPGVVDAWRVAADRFGSVPLADLLQDAVHYAEAGFPLTGRNVRQNREMEAIGLRVPETRAVFYPQGESPARGALFRQPDLATTLRVLQRDGPEAFYRGTIAEAMLAAARRDGGLFTEEDFSRHRTEILPAIETTYRSWAVYEQPPVSQGVILLMALNVLEATQIEPEAGARVHQQVEAHKLALRERLQRIGDPAMVQLDLPELLSKDRARSLARRIDPEHAARLQPVPAGQSDTTYLCVVDEARTVVSYIQSLYGNGGNGVVAGRTGVLFNNRMACFSLDPASPNRLAGGKRPVHTLNSWILRRDERWIVGGTPGSFWQVQTNLQLISQLVDRGRSPQEAIDEPRWRMGPSTSWSDAWLELEGRLGESTAASLRGRGHEVRLIGDWEAGGAAQIIEITPTGLTGATDPRPGTGTVLGY